MTSVVVSRTGHVGLNVSDLDRSVDFYTAVFRLTVRNRSDEPGRKFAYLGDEQGLVLTLWEQSTGAFSPHAAGLHHLAFQVGSSTELEAVTDRIRSQGAPILHDGIVAHRTGAASGGVFFTDPDGIRLEISAPDAGKNHPAPHAEAPTCGFF